MFTFYTGPMFACKTERLLEQARYAFHAKQKLQFIVPKKDNRHGVGVVKSHAGRSEIEIPTFTVEYAEELVTVVRPKTKVLLVDESHLFKSRDLSLGHVLFGLESLGVEVHVSGLDLNYEAKPLQESLDILAYASKVVKQHAACMKCGQPARFSWLHPSARDGDTHKVGGAEIYQARCFKCWHEDE